MVTLKEDDSSWASDGIKRRDFKNDHGDGYSETPHRKNKSKNKGKKREGCPANNNGPHVYVWVTLRFSDNGRDRLKDFRYEPYWNNYERFKAYLESYEVKLCCGCNKRDRRGWRKVMKT